MMARPRKTGERFPSGRLREQSDEFPPARIKRVIEEAKARSMNTWLGEPIGWLRLNGEVTDALVAAAEIYQKARAKHDAALGIPSRSARSCDLNSARGVSNSDRDGKKARAGFEKVRDAVFTVHGIELAPKVIEALDHVLVELRHPASWQIVPLKAGLYIVAEMHGLAGTGRRQVVNRSRETAA